MIKIKTEDKNGENPCIPVPMILEELANWKLRQKVFKHISEKVLRSQPLTKDEKLLMNYMLFYDRSQEESSNFDLIKSIKDFWYELFAE